MAPNTGESQIRPTQPIVDRVSRLTRIAWAEAAMVMARMAVANTCGQSTSHHCHAVDTSASMTVRRYSVVGRQSTGETTAFRSPVPQVTGLVAFHQRGDLPASECPGAVPRSC